MRFYATTPIYYVNAKPHIGHAYTTIITDIFCRYHKLAGYDACFITGTDEHGDKIVQAAGKNGQSLTQYTNQISSLFRDAWPKLNIDYSAFVRTTEERHKKAVTIFLERVNKKGDLYFGQYGGYYCFGCERFYTEKELKDGLCPDHRTPLQYIAEENYFFRMGNYQDWLIDYIRKNDDFIRPERYRNEVLGLLREPLEDLCISRPKTRLTWGIDLPFDEKFVTYVWFDALISYISIIGWPDGELFSRYWPVAQHFIAKDILKPHAIFWPTMLKSGGLELYRHLNVHGYWQLGQAKMGKSVGNVVDALALSETYGVEAFRYFLARDMVFGLDSEFVEDALVNRYNADLANDLGNLWQRSLTMLIKFGGGCVPSQSVRLEDEDAWEKSLSRYLAEYRENFRALAVHRALAVTWDLISALNKFIDTEAPWALAKDPMQTDRLQGVLRRLVTSLGVVGALIWPVLPKTGEEMWRRLGLDPGRLTLDLTLIQSFFLPGRPVVVGESFFPRVEFGDARAVIQAAAPGTLLARTADSVSVETVTLEEFKRLDLRVAEVIAAEAVPKSSKLLKLTLRVGQEDRTVVAGLAGYYTPDQLLGCLVVIIANLAPAKFMGITSQGMVLAAVQRDGAEDKLTFITPVAPLSSGSKVS